MAADVEGAPEPDDAREEQAGTAAEEAREQAVARADESAAAELARADADAAAAAPTDDAAPTATELAPLAEELWERLVSELGDAVVEHGAALGDLVVRVRPDAWRRTAEVARDRLECDYLSFVSAVDWMPRPAETGGDAGGDTSSPVQPSEMTFGVAGSAGRFQVLARVASTSRHWGVTLKCDVDADDPVVQSWVEVYPGADWHERECWEMYGFWFDGHPAIRHLYLPSDFEGHPLRKDFPLLAREVKPWPGLVDVEDMPTEAGELTEGDAGAAGDADAGGGEETS